MSLHIANMSVFPEMIYRISLHLKKKKTKYLNILHSSEINFAFSQRLLVDKKPLHESCLVTGYLHSAKVSCHSLLTNCKEKYVLLQWRELAVTLLTREQTQIHNDGMICHDVTCDVTQYKVPTINYEVFVPKVFNLNLAKFSSQISYL